MKYFLQRDGRTYGPYSFDDLKRYQAENRIGPNDMVRREDSQNWEPWQQALNPPAAAPAAPAFTPPAAPVFIPPAQPAPAPAPSFQPPAQQGFGTPPAQPSPFGGAPANDPWAHPAPSGGFGSTPPAPQPDQGAFGGFGQQAQGFGQHAQGFGQHAQGFGQHAQGFGQQVQQGFGQAGFGGTPAGGFSGGGGVGPMPPDMQWYILLLINIVCGLFGLYWIFKQAGFVQQIDPQSTAKKKYITGLIALIGSYVFIFLMSVIAAMADMPALGMLSMLGMIGVLGAVVFLILAHFEMRKSIHNYYNTVEPMGINLMDTQGAVLTFFFNIYFFQYHFANIAARKKAMGHQ